MKHTIRVIIILVLFFFLAQFTGLLIINHYIDHVKTIKTKSVEWKPLPYNLERPKVENPSFSFIYIVSAVLVGTILILFLIRFNSVSLFKVWLYTAILRVIGYSVLYLSKDGVLLVFFLIADLLLGYLAWKFKFTVEDIWKLWFFATVWLTLSIAFAAFISSIISVILAFILAVLKLYRPNIITQNISEVFIYGGLAAIFVPIINIFAAFMLLAIISAYDFIAVFKTKHMVKLATFQSKSKIFAGLMIPYGRKKDLIKSKMFVKSKDVGGKEIKMNSKEKISGKAIAVLGGGDIGFTLIFAGVVMQALMLQEPVLTAFLKALVIPIFCSIALLILLLKGQQNKFYPAMPVLSMGCFLGYLVVLMI